jgi:hypothetical protein
MQPPSHIRRFVAASRSRLGRGLDRCIRTAGRLRFGDFDPRDAICVSGIARGGTTWLAELLASDPRHLLIFEPLAAYSGREPFDHGFNWLNYRREGDDWSRQQAFLDATLRGHMLNRRTLRPWRSAFAPQTYTRLVVKFINANMLLPFLHRAFDARCVMLIRHPCAVVSSQLRWGAKVTKRSFFIPPGLFDDYPHLERIFSRIEGKAEVLAFEWAIQQLPALTHARPYPWLIVFYEYLYRDRTSQLARLCDFFDLDPATIAVARSYRPSRVTMPDSPIVSGQSQLDSWRRKLDGSTIGRILDVVHACGVEVYGDSELPVEAAAAELARDSGSAPSGAVRERRIAGAAGSLLVVRKRRGEAAGGSPA